MTNPRTHQLYSGAVASAGGVVLGEVPAGQRWLVKYVNFVTANASVTAAYVGMQGGGHNAFFFFEAPPVVFEVYNLTDLYAVLDEGDELVAYVDNVAAGASYVHIGGLIFEPV